MTETHDFMEALFGGAPKDLYILVWTVKGGEKLSHWFQLNYLQDAAGFARLVEKHDCYLGVALSDRDWGSHKRCHADDTVGLVGLWADVDVAHAVHKKTNLPPTIEAARELIDDPHRPATVVIDSGHGLQAWWLFDQPWIFTEAVDVSHAHSGIARAEARKLIEGWQGRLRERSWAKGWAMDSTQDLARVMRIPGTMNCKAEPFMPVRILEANWERRYRPEELRLESAANSGQVVRQPKTAIVVVGAITIDPEAEPPLRKLEVLLANDRKFKQSWERKRTDLKDTSASGYDQSLAIIAAMAGWTDQEITNLLVYSRVKRGEKLKTDRNPPEKYYVDTIAFARKAVMEEKRIDSLLDRQQEEPTTSDNDEPAPAAKHQQLVDTLSEILGFRIQRFVRYVAATPVFRIETRDGSTMIGTAGCILDFAVFRAKVAGLPSAHVIEPEKRLRARWVQISQMILDACEVEEVGDEATERGAVRSWLRDYFGDNKPVATIQEAVALKQPFTDDNGFGFFEQSFRHWLSIRWNERIGPKDLGTMFRAAKIFPKIMPVEITGKRTTRNVWYVDPGLLA